MRGYSSTFHRFTAGDLVFLGVCVCLFCWFGVVLWGWFFVVFCFAFHDRDLISVYEFERPSELSWRVRHGGKKRYPK